MAHFEALVEMLDGACEQTWCNKLFSLARCYGFEHTLFAIVPNRRTSLETAFLRSNYAPRWRNTYDEGNFLRFDPTVSHCVLSSLPLVWSPEIFAAPRQKEMYEEASGFGLRSGITLPIHGPGGELGIMCFVADVAPGKQFLQEAKHCLPGLSLLRDYALESSAQFANPSKENNEKVHLTPRELECMKWAMNGKSSWEIGKILRCSEAAINFHMANIRRKFSVTTRQQAIVKAIGLGLIAPG